MRYLLNSPVLTDYGCYSFEPLALADAQAMARTGLASAVGHAATACYLSARLGVPVSEARRSVRMDPGDEALVFRLLQRQPEGHLLDADELERQPHAFARLIRLA